MKFCTAYFQPRIVAIVLLLGTLSSCSYQHYKGYEADTKRTANIPLIFDQTFKKAIYSTKLSVFGRELSGITVVKKQSAANSIHVVFMSQIGLKFFDIEIKPGEKEDWFEVNYLMESLNREIVISALKTDLMLLFSQYPEEHTAAVFRAPESKEHETIIRFDKYVSSVFSDANDNATGIVFRKGHAVKTTIHITPGGNYPESLNINNKKGEVNITWKEIRM